MKSAKVSATAIRTMLALAVLFLVFALLPGAAAQKNKDDDPSAVLSFLVIKEDNGKPVRSAAVIVHPVNTHGKQARGGFELKTDADGRTSFDGVPYGKLRVQVLASGFQTFGEDYEVDHTRMDFTIRLKRPQGQYSIYQDHPGDSNQGKKDDKTPTPDPSNKPQ